MSIGTGRILLARTFGPVVNVEDCEYIFWTLIRHGPFDIQGGGAWVFGPGQNISFGKNRSKVIFFAGSPGRIIFFSLPKATFMTYRFS